MSAPLWAVVLAVLFGFSFAFDAAPIYGGGKSAAQWASSGRRIYQVLTDRFAPDAGTRPPCRDLNDYCGGTFAGLEAHLGYIKGLGFNAVWISPVIANTPGGYHGYWACDFFMVNPHFGTEAQLRSFVAAAHDAGIWVMVDVVVNHVGPVGNDFTTIRPFNSTAHYHKDCAVTKYQCFTEEVQKCRLAHLPDLDQSVPFVRQQLSAYVVDLLSTFGFDGVRADTVMYIDKPYWGALQSGVLQGRTYIAGEVYSSQQCNIAYTHDGIDATLNYPLFFSMRGAFAGGQPLTTLSTAVQRLLQFPHPQWEVNFLDNHDNDRFMSLPGATAKRYKHALGFMMLLPGRPCIYYGTERLFRGFSQNNSNRQAMWPTGFSLTGEMVQFVSNLTAAHSRLNATDAKDPSQFAERWKDDDVYCYYNGPFVVCTTTAAAPQVRTLQDMWSYKGRCLCDVLQDTTADMTRCRRCQWTRSAGRATTLTVAISPEEPTILLAM